MSTTNTSDAATTKKHGALFSGVAGAVAGGLSQISLHPLDVVKTRFQSNKTPSRPQPPASTTPITTATTSASASPPPKALHPEYQYRHTVHALTTIYRTEGFRALYAGLSPALLGSGASWGLYFFAYNFNKRQLERLTGQKQLGPLYHLLAGINSGVFTTLFTNPIWLIKTRMQLQQRSILLQQQMAATTTTTAAATAAATAAIAPEDIYKNMFDATKKIVRHEGFFGLYKGIGPALIMTSHGALQFMAYEELRRFFIHHFASIPTTTTASTTNTTTTTTTTTTAATTGQAKDLNSGYFLLAGALSKFFASTATYPLQVVKTRLQDQRNIYASGDAKYKNTFDTIKKIYRYEGLRGFYKGIVPNTLRVTPSAAITFYIYEIIIRLF